MNIWTGHNYLFLMVSFVIYSLAWQLFAKTLFFYVTYVNIVKFIDYEHERGLAE